MPNGLRLTALTAASFGVLYLRGYAMTWLLVLNFACAAECGSLTKFTFPRYASQEACTQAGNVWMRPEANPMNALRGFGCYQGSVPPVSMHRD